MAEYGITDKGFEIKRLDEILEELHSELSGKFGFNTRLDPQSFLNVLITTYGGQISELWEVAQASYYAKYPSTAEGVSLDNAVQYGGIRRSPNKYSYYTLHCTGDDGTVVRQGATVATNTAPQAKLAAVSEFVITRESFNKVSIRVPHAEGGIFSTPHYGVFAEDGPESFIPIDGSKRSVDIWEQTGKLLGTIGNDNEVDNYISTQNNTEMVLTREVNTKETPILLPSDNGSQQVPVVTDTQDKTVTLKIEGSGNLQVGSNLSKNDVVEILMDNVKEAIMGIIEQEILEEGVGSYVF